MAVIAHLIARTVGANATALEYAKLHGSGSLSPLPAPLHAGLSAVAVLSILSLVSSVTLLAILCKKLVSWSKSSTRSYNQFVILIMNLLLADIQQSLGFLLNLEWVVGNKINIASPACKAQGWFVSAGDVASGVWCLAIGIHTAASLLCRRRLSSTQFYLSIAAAWLFVYSCAAIPLIMHKNIYVRAEAWCWIDERYAALRLYSHYLWIFTAEFGVIAIYGATYFALNRRIYYGYYDDEKTATRARSVAKLMAVYPLVYVVCTLPLASARMAALAGIDVPFSFLAAAGSMITSNGWLDVLLYTITRRVLLLSDESPEEDCGLDTFEIPWETSRFGTVTTITAGDNLDGARYGFLNRLDFAGRRTTRSRRSSISSFFPSDSTTDLKLTYMTLTVTNTQEYTPNDTAGTFQDPAVMEVTTETTVEVQVEDIQPVRMFVQQGKLVREATTPTSTVIDFGRKI